MKWSGTGAGRIAARRTLGGYDEPEILRKLNLKSVPRVLTSDMPGKVNPVILEVVSQVAYQVVGNDLTITMAAEAGQLQLNAMEPVIAYNIFESMRIMENAMRSLREKWIVGIQADRIRCEALFAESLVMAAALVPTLGYDKCSDAAKLALATGRSFKKIVIEKNLMTSERFEVAVASCLKFN